MLHSSAVCLSSDDLFFCPSYFLKSLIYCLFLSLCFQADPDGFPGTVAVLTDVESIFDTLAHHHVSLMKFSVSRTPISTAFYHSYSVAKKEIGWQSPEFTENLGSCSKHGP